MSGLPWRWRHCALLAGETVEVDGAMCRMMHDPGQAPGRPIQVPILFATAGAGAAVVFHRAFDRPAPGRPNLEQLAGGEQWRARIEAIDESVRHLHTHEGYLTFVNDIDRGIISGDLVRQFTFSGDTKTLRERLVQLQRSGVTEVAFQPAGSDIERELDAFAAMAGLTSSG